MLTALGISLFLFPVDSDGAFASFDGVAYGMEAEGKEQGLLAAFHPLFHAIAPVVTSAVRAMGLSSPGQVAVRIVSGLGAAVLLLLVASAAGRRRWMAGLAFAVSLLSTRSFLTNAAVGETILPACAAAIWALHEATRTPVRTNRVWAALALALLLRADNILIVPGVAWALWRAQDRPARAAPIAKGLLFTAAVTLAGYVSFWWAVTRGQRPIWDTLFPETVHHWTGAGGPGLSRLGAHVDSLSAAVVGRIWPLDSLNLWIGPGFVALSLVAAFLLRGTASVKPLGTAVVVTILIRAIFFSWYDATTPKWAVLTLAMIALLGARLAQGEPRRAASARVAGALLLVLLASATLATHGPFLLRLRDRRFIGAMTHAVEEGRGCRFAALGPNVNLALDFLRVPHTVLGMGTNLDEALPVILGELRAHPEPTMIVYERWTSWMPNGAPYMMIHPPPGRILIDDALPPEWRLVTWEGVAYAARYDPKPAPR